MNIYNCKFLRPFGINAMVVYPFILYYDKAPAESIIQHELIHIAQIKRLGVGKFYARYLYEYLIGRKKGLSHFEAYRNISFEREAYRDESPQDP